MSAHLVWAKGGEAYVLSLSLDAIVLRSTVSSPPGSRVEGRLHAVKTEEGPNRGSSLRVKVHGSKRQPEGDFVIEGRLLDATRELRARLEALTREANRAGPTGVELGPPKP